MAIMDHSPAARIFWDGRKGVACGPHARIVLDEKPALGFRYVEIDYCPGITMQIRREPWHSPEDLNSDEAECCKRYLLTLRIRDSDDDL